MADKKVLLIDGMALAYRSHFAFIRANLVNNEGISTGSIMGFANTVDKLIEEYEPSHLAVAWDTHAPTFRHDWDERYKAQRPPQPEELRVGIPLIKEMLGFWNIPNIEKDGYEADDIIGTLAYSIEAGEAEVFLVTPDKDFMQLVNDYVCMLKPNNKNGGFDRVDEDGVKEYFGVYPNQVIDVLALLGDASDNIPGVPGIGKKGAPKLIEQFESLDNLLDQASTISAKRQRESLIEFADEARHARKMVTIKTDVPGVQSWTELVRADPDWSNLAVFFSRMGFRSLTRKYEELASGNTSPVGSASSRDDRSYVSDSPKKSVNEGETNPKSLNSQSEASQADNEHSPIETALDLFAASKKAASYNANEVEYRLLDNEVELLAYLESVDLNRPLVVDTETDSADPLSANLVGIAMTQESHKAVYVPFNPEWNIALKQILGSSELLVIAHNYKFDYTVLQRHGIELSGKIFDTMIAAYLIDSDQRLKMDELSLRYLQYEPIPITELIGKGKGQLTMADVPREALVPYACEDADITFRLYTIFSEKLEKDGLHEVAFNLDFPLSRVLARMEASGIALDTKLLKDFSTALSEDMLRLKSAIFDQCGEEFNLNSPAQLGDILFDKLGLPAGKKTKTGKYSTNEAVLSKLAHVHKVPEQVLEYRSLAKLQSTYADALPSLLSPISHRLHTNYNQCVAATGRLASSNPNLQNIPIRTTRSREIRKAFIAEEGYKILSADYSQVELRIIAHISEDQDMIHAFKSGEDIHARTAKEIFSLDSLDQVTSDHRRKAKEVNFGIPYGLSAFGLAQNLGISNGEAKEMIDAYFGRFPNISAYIHTAKEFVKEHGYVKTLMGRRRYLPDIESGNWNARAFAERAAINMPIQGTAADIIKVAMLSLDQWMREENSKSRMLLQVHDELIFELHEDEKDWVPTTIVEKMEQAIELLVPLKVEWGIGDHWLAAH
jgi:DNA polymerase I